MKVPRRRGVIRCLIENEDRVVTAKTLSCQIASMEQEISVEQVTGEDYQKVYVSLIQQHLSQLADANIIDYDSDRKTVKRGPNFLLGAIILSQTYAITQLWYENLDRAESATIQI